MKRLLPLLLRAPALVLIASLALTGCESINSLGKRIDYKSAASAPSLEIPPDLASPAYDDRYAVTTASGLAAQSEARPKQTDLLPTSADARVAHEGNERWLVVKTTPEQAWVTVRKFGMTEEEASHHHLQITGTTDEPDPGTHIGTLAYCPKCSVAFDLVTTPKVNGWEGA